MNWNGIAPFNEPCELAPGWPGGSTAGKMHKTTVKYVTVNGVCCECEEPFTREVSAGNASRTNICGERKCKLSRQRKINKRNKRQAA